jgi:hypothetical protein
MCDKEKRMKEEALKLAEKAESMAIEIPADWSSGEPKNSMTDIADMIRKLVAKIEVCERDYNFMYSYAKGLEQVEKDLKAEQKVPIKPLSDEKIQELADRHLTYILYDEDEYGYEVEITGELAFYDAIIEEINKGDV